MIRNLVRLAGTFIVVSSTCGCSCEEEPEQSPPSEEESGQEAPAQAAEVDPTVTSEHLSLLSIKDRCTLWQSGLVLDLGNESSDSRRAFRLLDPDPVQIENRFGTGFRHLDQMNTDFVFWLTEPMEDFEVAARVISTGSERMAAYIDGKRLGAASLKSDQPIVASISGRDRTLERGRHRLTLSLSRPTSGSLGADFSWVRIGSRPETNITLASVSDTFSEVTVEETRMRSVVLRPGARLRCPIRIPAQARLKTQWGIWGEGSAEVEVAVHTDDGQRIVVASAEREADDPRAFQTLEADLTPFASQFVDLELTAPRALGRSQVAFADPKVVSPAPEEEKAVLAKRAIVIVLSGLGAKHMPPTAAEHGLPVVNQLAQSAAVFPQYRASTTSVPGVVASLFTGLAPWQHGVDEAHDVLPSEITSIASAMEAQGGRTAFFTGVPLSAAPLGFERGFAKFDSIHPQEDEAAVEPLTRAIKWLGTQVEHPGPVLCVVHLRGGHPPFDITQETTAELAPKEYGGELTPRRAAIQLSEIRSRQASRNRQMPQEDWTRLFSMQKAALLKQNAELSAMIAWLRKRDIFDDSLVVVMGDVGAGEPPTIPFSTKSPLSEEALAVPLLIKFPDGHLAGERIEGWFAPRDVAKTIDSVLGLEKDFGDLDLSRESAPMQARARPHMAYRAGEYSMLFDSWLLLGHDGKAPRLCEPSLDPTCQEDRSESRILAARALWLSAWNILHPALSAQPPKESSEPIDELVPDSPEQAFENALTVWGVDR